MMNSFGKYAAQYPHLVRLGVPITVGQLGTIVLGFADTLMIGHHSLQELAAASFVTNMFTLAFVPSTLLPSTLPCLPTKNYRGSMLITIQFVQRLLRILMQPKRCG